MSYLLDTNTVSALMKGVSPVSARVAQISPADVAIAQVTAAEIEFGIRRVASAGKRGALRDQWRVLDTELMRVPWDDVVSRVFGERKARLESAGRRMSDFDLAIAAHAIAFDCTLVIADGDFARLAVRRENWLL